jgi:RNA polymerase sigma-70 factor (ECF subfamily)
MTETRRQPAASLEESPAEGPAADADDVRAALGGDRGAFDRLVLRHQQAVVNAASYYLGNHEDALEVAQEAFLKAYRALPGFGGRSSFRTWILRITLNTARSLHASRRAKKRAGRRVRLDAAREEEGEALEIAGTSEAPDVLLLRKEVKEAIERAILALEPEAREVIILRDLNGESYDSIARTLDLPVGTVKSKVHRARLELRQALKDFL